MFHGPIWRPTRGSLLAGWLFIVVGSLAGCGQPPAPQAPARPAAVASVPTPAGSAPVSTDRTTTSRYAIAIDYPVLPSDADVLLQALHQDAAAAKCEFLRALPDPQKFPQFASRQLQLLIGYRVTARSPAFISVRGEGMMDTGGAHPTPLNTSFVFDRPERRMLTLDDLFVDPVSARGTLAAYARAALQRSLLAQAPKKDEATPKVRQEWLDNMRGMINAGTTPEAKNFGQFQIDAGGLLLVFPPYQVAPYVYGTQTVVVPLEVFATALKPRYRPEMGSGSFVAPGRTMSEVPFGDK